MTCACRSARAYTHRHECAVELHGRRRPGADRSHSRGRPFPRHPLRRPGEPVPWQAAANHTRRLVGSVTAQYAHVRVVVEVRRSHDAPLLVSRDSVPRPLALTLPSAPPPPGRCFPIPFALGLACSSLALALKLRAGGKPPTPRPVVLGLALALALALSLASRATPPACQRHGYASGRANKHDACAHRWRRGPAQRRGAYRLAEPC